MEMISSFCLVDFQACSVRGCTNDGNNDGISYGNQPLYTYGILSTYSVCSHGGSAYPYSCTVVQLVERSFLLCDSFLLCGVYRLGSSGFATVPLIVLSSVRIWKIFVLFQ